jgi:hypothetical protein
MRWWKAAMTPATYAAGGFSSKGLMGVDAYDRGVRLKPFGIR